MTRWTRTLGPIPAALALAALLGCPADGDGDDLDDTCTDAAAWLDQAWDAWAAGDIDDAALLAGDALGCDPTDGARHLLADVAFVTGDYQGAIDLADAVAADYERADELPELAIEALCHLHRCDEALAVAEAAGLGEEVTGPLQLRVDHPLQVELDGLTAIPFDPGAYLAAYLPALEATFAGEARTARLDTGGAFVATSVQTASELGVETPVCTTGYQGNQPTEICHGILPTMTLGDATFANVPLITMSTLTLHDPIVGTSVFEQFLTTIDYPRDRLLLSPRGDAGATADHLAELPGEPTEVPFHLWGDHFLFAGGAVGEREGMTWFVDSGLVAVDDGTQAALRADTETLLAWGLIDSPDDDTAFLDLGMYLSLGPLSQAGHTVVHDTSEHGNWDFGGVRTDGLLGHAFVVAYAWTLDFDAMRFRFTP